MIVRVALPGGSIRDIVPQQTTKICGRSTPDSTTHKRKSIGPILPLSRNGHCELVTARLRVRDGNSYTPSTSRCIGFWIACKLGQEMLSLGIWSTVPEVVSLHEPGSFDILTETYQAETLYPV